MDLRRLSSGLFRRRIDILDKINNNADYMSDYASLLKDAPVAPDRSALYRGLFDRIGNAPVTYLEFGVWRGDSFRQWLGGNTCPDSRFFGFDTFSGLPEDWLPEFPAGAFSTGGVPPHVDDFRARFIAGLFQDTLYGFLDEDWPSSNRLILNLDSDLYSSTLFVLATMDRFLAPGSIILLDEYRSLNHEYQAWRDYRRAFPHGWQALGRTPDSMRVAFEMVA